MSGPSGIPHIDLALIYDERIETVRIKIEETLNSNITITPEMVAENPDLVAGKYRTIPEAIETIRVTLDQPNGDPWKAWIESPTIPFSQNSTPKIKGTMHVQIPDSDKQYTRSMAIASYHAIKAAGAFLGIAGDGFIDNPVIMYGENNSNVTISTVFTEI